MRFSREQFCTEQAKPAGSSQSANMTCFSRVIAVPLRKMVALSLSLSLSLSFTYYPQSKPGRNKWALRPKVSPPPPHTKFT
ncbi:hypothetical protein Mapa_014399 [Marchantia paleacea]|nr:hypothetical protein Mapa_014399 [Marchantia paleacea]